MSESTFTIAPDNKSITCHKCGRTSHHPKDIQFHYCGNCNLWHDGPNLQNADNEKAVLELTKAIGQLARRVMPAGYFFFTYYQKPQKNSDGTLASIATNVPEDELAKLFRGLAKDWSESEAVTVRAE